MPNEVLETIDTLNKYGVARAHKNTVVILNPPQFTEEGVGPLLTKADALNLAAYLVLMIGDQEAFSATMKAISES